MCGGPDPIVMQDKENGIDIRVKKKEFTMDNVQFDVYPFDEEEQRAALDFYNDQGTNDFLHISLSKDTLLCLLGDLSKKRKCKK